MKSISLPAKKRTIKIGRRAYYLSLPKMKFWFEDDVTGYHNLNVAFVIDKKLYPVPFSNIGYEIPHGESYNKHIVNFTYVCLGKNKYDTLEEAIELFFASKFQYRNRNFKHTVFQQLTGKTPSQENIKKFLENWESQGEFFKDYTKHVKPIS